MRKLFENDTHTNRKQSTVTITTKQVKENDEKMKNQFAGISLCLSASTCLKRKFKVALVLPNTTRAALPLLKVL